MTVSQAFIEHCHAKAARFLKSVVIVDDRITWNSAPNPTALSATRPSMSAAIEGDEPESPTSFDEATEFDRSMVSDVDIETFTRSFAPHGIVAGFMKPVIKNENKDAIVKEIADLSDAADVLLIDWFLDEAANAGEQQKITIDAIQSILTKDARSGGRVRLIVIYTAERISTVQQELIDALQQSALKPELLDADPDDRLKNIPCISLEHGLLAVVSKNEIKYSVNATLQVHDVVVRLFSKLNRGLLASTALDAIAVVREKTHHLLAQFSQEHDGAYVAHRCLLADPEDAEVFVERMIGDELRAEIALQRVGRGVSQEKVEVWADHLPEASRSKIVELAKMLDAKDKMSRVKTKLELANEATPSAVVSNLVEHCFSTARSPDNGAISISHLSRLSTVDFDMEKVNAYASNWAPRLALGTILCNGNDYVLCMMPKCDSVRIPAGARVFPFLNLHKVGGQAKFNLVIKWKDQFVKFDVQAMGHHLVTLNFDAPKGFVEGARNQSGAFEFLNKVNGNQTKRYQWVTELKEGKALQFAQVLSGQLNRIGLDDFEPLRLAER